MPKGMKFRDITKALRAHGCTEATNSGRGDHVKWICGCGKHSTALPRHRQVTPGVVGAIIKHMECLPGGWLQ